MSLPDCVASASTPRVAGAIAVVTLIGDVEPVLRRLTGREQWPVGTARHVEIHGLDDLVAARPAATTAILTPHGGPHIVTRLLERLAECGAQIDLVPDSESAALRFPEASDQHEALALELMSRATSPLALPLLLDQPRRWREVEERGIAPTEADRERSARLDRLLTPPRVAVVGVPNAGKSTLINHLAGREVAIASAAPGTTRDHLTTRADMSGLVVELLDTPGVRDDADRDEIERDAARLAAPAIATADLILALAAPGQAWPTLSTQVESRTVRIGGHADLALRDDAELSVSGVTGQGIDRLRALVRDRLVPADDRAHPGPWLVGGVVLPARCATTRTMPSTTRANRS